MSLELMLLLVFGPIVGASLGISIGYCVGWLIERGRQ
jgi:NhaP-type Na+/H+ or K+/H+ antiporter